MNDRSTQTAAGRLPGDLTKDELIDRIIRVDHAGEFGAKRIYEGQLAVLRRQAGGAGDQPHVRSRSRSICAAFEKLMVERRVRPTRAASAVECRRLRARRGDRAARPKAAMACTVAVEEVIDEHYRAQSDQLGADEAPLKAKIDKFRAEELEHRDTGLEHGARAGARLSAADRRDQGRLAAWRSGWRSGFEFAIQLPRHRASPRPLRERDAEA